MPHPSLVRVLARAFLAGETAVDPIVARASRTLGRPWRWLPALAQRFVRIYADRTRPRYGEVVQFLLRDRGFARAWSKHVDELALERWRTEPQQMQPVPAARTWDLPAIESAAALAEWFGITPGELEWFADLKGLGVRARDRPLLRHYRYRVLEKMSGSVRLIEAPKPRLKQLQGQILSRILEKIPPHAAVHGFCKGRSIKTFIAPHVGRHVILRMDLQDFFPSISGRRIQALFRTAGYPEPVADLLGGICTNAVPQQIWNGEDWQVRSLYARPHLPQGAPASPALANLCAYRADCRLAGLAKSVGAAYTRYADDLAFSGDESFERCVERFSIHAAVILHEEGFAVHHRKTRIMRQGVRQHLVGLVANQRANVIRADFDRLKAILTNCVRQGPESQNREAHPSFRAHLTGRVAFVESIDPLKGERLRALLNRIDWPLPGN